MNSQLASAQEFPEPPASPMHHPLPHCRGYLPGHRAGRIRDYRLLGRVRGREKSFGMPSWELSGLKTRAGMETVATTVIIAA